MGGWGMGLGWLVPLVIFGLVVWAVVALVRARTGGAAGAEGDAEDRSLAILKERYARGELDAETYRRMRRDLEA